MKEFIEIPFGAKDSELGGWEYNIPEGFVASIENGKIVVKKEESDYERIRKEILEYFQQFENEELRGVNISDWIAWLENVKTPFINNTDNSFICDIKNIIDEAPGVLQSDKNRLIAWLEKQGERVAKKESKCDADKKELKKIENKPLVIDEGKAEMDYCFTKMMNGEKVSSAWSEKDENNLKAVCAYLQDYSRLSKISDIKRFNEYCDWLKSLKDKIKGE